MTSRLCALNTALILFAAGMMLIAPATADVGEPLTQAPAASAPTKTFGSGYRLTGADGSVYAFGATIPGSLRGITLRRPIVGMASTPRFGYWLVASDGGIFSFGDATFHGSTGNIQLNKPIVSMAPTPTGRGYWLVASDGGIFSFGDATFHGSTGNIQLNKPIVGVAATPTGRGYWLVASDGGIFSFGDATFHGSTGNIQLNKPIVGIAATPTGRGYWLVASDGGIFSFGDATFHGSTGNIQLNKPIVGIAATPTGRGYWLVASDGGIFSFGDATFHGSTGGQSIPAPIVGIATQPQLNPYQPRSTGYDISWPQCGGPYPASPHAITIVGINRGLTFSTNPCLASEAAWAGSSLTVYVNVDGLPNDSVSGVSGPVQTSAVSNLRCRAYNWGAAAADYDIAAAKSAGVHASMWWLDVEIGKPWRADDKQLNVEVIKAMRDRFQRRGFIVGIYSNVYQWGVITGGTFVPGLPLWVPGAKSAAEAVQYCSPARAFGGGVIWLTQWTTQYDNNYACNG